MQPQEFLLHGLQNEGHIEKGGSEIEKYSCNYFRGGIGYYSDQNVNPTFQESFIKGMSRLLSQVYF